MLFSFFSAASVQARDGSRCSSTQASQGCLDIYDRHRNFPVNILYLSPGSSSCPSPLKMLLVLFAFILMHVIVTVLCYAVRLFSRIRYWHGEVAVKPRDICVLTPVGSLLIQIVGTVGSGYILAAQDAEADPSVLTMLWFARPLAPIFLTPTRDQAEACEMLLADIAYRFIAIGGFGAATHALDSLNDNKSAFPGLRESYIPYLKAGAGLGILGFLGSLFFILASAIGRVRHILWVQWQRYWWLSILCLLFLHVLYILASWFLWAGLLNFTPQGLCPSDRTLSVLAVLWFFVAVLDNSWRGFSLLLAIGDPDSGCPHWIVKVGNALDRVIGVIFGSRRHPSEA